MVITVHNINKEQEENEQEEDEEEEQEREAEEEEQEAEQQQQQQQQQQQDEQQQRQQPMINDSNWGNLSEGNIIAGRLRPTPKGWEKNMRGGCWGGVWNKQ